VKLASRSEQRRLTQIQTDLSNVPSQLTMPDFSLQPGGFGVGLAASNVPIWITVLEEWNACEVRIQ